MQAKTSSVIPWRLRNLVHSTFRSITTSIKLGLDLLTGALEKPCHHSMIGTKDKVTILIPTLSKGQHADHLEMLHRLLTVFLPRQTHSNYHAIVYCDGPNDAVARLVDRIGDVRVQMMSTEETLARWGHPQTRLGIAMAEGSFFVRMNDDNHPFPNFLETLICGMGKQDGFSYARVIYKGEARRAYGSLLKSSFIIPQDRYGNLRNGNIDCMNYMVRTDIAKRFVNSWTDDYTADWRFIEAMIKSGIESRFINRIIGEKW